MPGEIVSPPGDYRVLARAASHCYANAYGGPSVSGHSARFGTCFLPINAVGAVPPRSGDKHGCMYCILCVLQSCSLCAVVHHGISKKIIDI